MSSCEEPEFEGAGNTFEVELGGQTFSFVQPAATWLGDGVVRGKNQQGNVIASLAAWIATMKSGIVSVLIKNTFETGEGVLKHMHQTQTATAAESGKIGAGALTTALKVSFLTETKPVKLCWSAEVFTAR